VKLVCASCGERIKADPALAGGQMPCPRCKTAVHVPSEAELAAVAVSPRRIVDYDGPTTIDEARRREAEAGRPATPARHAPGRTCWIVSGIGVLWMLLPLGTAEGVAFRFLPSAAAGGSIAEGVVLWLPLIVSAVAIAAAYVPPAIASVILAACGAGGLVLMALAALSRAGGAGQAALAWLELLALGALAGFVGLNLRRRRGQRPSRPWAAYSLAVLVALLVLCWAWAAGSGLAVPGILGRPDWAWPPRAPAQWLALVGGAAALVGLLVTIAQTLATLTAADSGALAGRILIATAAAAACLSLAAGYNGGVHRSGLTFALVLLTAHSTVEALRQRSAVAPPQPTDHPGRN
jgi:hypothetical protein